MNRTTLIWIAAIYFLAAHVLLAYFLYANAQRSGTNLEFKTTLHEYYLRLDDSIAAGSNTNGTLVFLGDSHIHALCTSCAFDESVSFGIPGLTVTELLEHANHYQTLAQASTIVVQIGHNDLKFHSNEEIIKHLHELQKQLPANARQIFTMQFPVIETVHDRFNGYNNRKTHINSAVLEMCEVDCETLDLSPHLGTKENVNSRYFSADGIHLSPSGNELWLKLLEGKLNAAS